MPNYEYKCVPGPNELVVKTFEESATAVRSYAKLINKEASEGWEFYSLETMSVTQAPGCFGMGPKTPPIVLNMLVFRREKKEETTI